MKASEDEREKERKKLISSQSGKKEGKKSLCERTRSLFRFISLGEYRTPLYFENKDSYKSATSGVLTIFSGLILASFFLYIFVPIFFMETYKS